MKNLYNVHFTGKKHVPVLFRKATILELESIFCLTMSIKSYAFVNKEESKLHDADEIKRICRRHIDTGEAYVVISEEGVVASFVAYKQTTNEKDYMVVEYYNTIDKYLKENYIFRPFIYMLAESMNCNLIRFIAYGNNYEKFLTTWGFHLYPLKYKNFPVYVREDIREPSGYAGVLR